MTDSPKVATAEGLKIESDYISGPKGEPMELVSVRIETRLSAKRLVPIHVAVIRMTNQATWVDESGPVEDLFYEVVLPVTDLTLKT